MRQEVSSPGRRLIISAALVRQFSANGDSHRAKHLRLKDEPLCNSHRKAALRLREVHTKTEAGIGVLNPHPNASVNWASDRDSTQQQENLIAPPCPCTFQPELCQTDFHLL